MTEQLIKYRFWFLCTVLISVALGACNTTKFLGEGETYLEKNTIEIVSEDEIVNKYLFDISMNNLIQQKPNGDFFFFFPREYFHYKNSAPGDSSWYNRFFMNYMAEAPSIFDERMTKSSAYSMRNYLVNKKGFYNANVDYSLDIEDSSTKVIYNVNLGPRYKINSIELFGTDTVAIRELNTIRKNSLIKKGDYIDAGKFDLELTRMSLAMQNIGYANFATNYIRIKGDSTRNDNSVDVFFELMPPLPDSTHQKYTIGNINVYTDYHREQDTARLATESFNDLHYYRQSNKFLVKPSSIDNSIFLKPGSIYNRDARSKTRKKLSELGAYRFVTLNAKIDESKDSIINYDIILTPFQKKWVADFGWDFFLSSTSQTSNGSNQVFGLSLSNQLKNRNLLGGSEQFTLSTEIGLEVQVDSLSSSSFVRSRSVGINGALEIPKQQSLLKLTPFLRKLGIISDENFQLLKEYTKTTIRGGYYFNVLLDSYSRSSINANLSYDYRPNKTSRYVLRQLGLEYNDYELQDVFKQLIVDNPLLLRSFDDNLLTGVFFRDLTYVYNKPINSKGNSYSIITTFETSGLETFTLNKLYNTLTGSNTEWRLTNNIEFAKYFRLELDPRYYKFFSDNHSLAMRLHAGLIVPFGGSDAAPFLKQFSVGGPNSMRGWDQKELGPGSHLEAATGQTFFQTGDIKLEANVEYRFDIFYIFEGALFVDAGNVWTLKENTIRPGAVISSDFADQIAVSAGYGIRFDFTYFNIRFDFGYRIRNPYSFANTSRNWHTWDEIKAQKFGNFQVAVNYPF